MLYKNLFYFDIETVGQYKDVELFKESDPRGYALFKMKYEKNPWMQERADTIAQAYLNNAPIFSTFGKIVCMSFGYYHEKTIQGYTVSSIYGDDEREIIEQVKDLIDKVSKRHMILAGFRIKAFDIPWLIHKMHKYNIEPPRLLDIYGKKPWDLATFDIADEWKQQFKYYISFDEVAYELGIDSPKDIIDGSKVHNAYWNDGDLVGIKTYCEKDTITCMKIVERMLKFRVV